MVPHRALMIAALTMSTSGCCCDGAMFAHGNSKDRLFQVDGSRALARGSHALLEVTDARLLSSPFDDPWQLTIVGTGDEAIARASIHLPTHARVDALAAGSTTLTIGAGGRLDTIQLKVAEAVSQRLTIPGCGDKPPLAIDGAYAVLHHRLRADNGRKLGGEGVYPLTIAPEGAARPMAEVSVAPWLVLDLKPGQRKVRLKAEMPRRTSDTKTRDEVAFGTVALEEVDGVELLDEDGHPTSLGKVLHVGGRAIVRLAPKAGDRVLCAAALPITIVTRGCMVRAVGSAALAFEDRLESKTGLVELRAPREPAACALELTVAAAAGAAALSQPLSLSDDIVHSGGGGGGGFDFD